MTAARLLLWQSPQAEIVFSVPNVCERSGRILRTAGWLASLSVLELQKDRHLRSEDGTLHPKQLGRGLNAAAEVWGRSADAE